MTDTLEQLQEKYFFVPTQEEITVGSQEYSREKTLKIRTYLAHHSGSTQYHAYQGFKLTDGVKDMAEMCGAFWLLDVILSHQISEHIGREEFQHWHLRPYKGSHGALVLCDDGNKNVLVAQHIPHTDFPLPDGIRLFVQNKVILLPTEY